jgi:hypothetical protein
MWPTWMLPALAALFCDERVSIGPGRRKWLLDEDVLAGVEQLTSHRSMRSGGDRDDGRVEVVEMLLEAVGRRGAPAGDQLAEPPTVAVDEQRRRDTELPQGR